jgi:hypothetical protein
MWILMRGRFSGFHREEPEMAAKTPAEKYLDRLAKNPAAANAARDQAILCLVNRMAGVHGHTQELAASALHATGEERARLVVDLNAQLKHAATTVAALRKADTSKVKQEWQEYDA